MPGEFDRNCLPFRPPARRLAVLVIAKVDERLTARRIKRLVHGLGIARDHGQIGARRLVGLGGALLPIALKSGAEANVLGVRTISGLDEWHGRFKVCPAQNRDALFQLTPPVRFWNIVSDARGVRAASVG
jgi:hypothetical protein